MRRNPLLMTVMGNPRTGPRSQKKAEEILNAAIGQAWAHLMSGVQVPIMDIPRIFRDVKLEMAGGLDVWAAVKAVGDRYRVNSNPCHGGRYRRNPGFIPMVAGGIAGSLVTHAMSNPGGPQFIVIDSQDGTVMYTKRATGMGNEAINSCVQVARKLAARNRKSYIVFLDLQRMPRGSQVNVGWARIMGITEEIHPDGSSARGNPSAFGHRARMCEHGAIDRRRCRMCRTRKHSKELTDLCPHGFSGGHRCRDCSPYKLNGSGGKRTISIEKFAAMVKAQRDPSLWRDFVAKCKAYHKWSHGTWPKRVTIEAVKKPGMKGMWITFDMGREPEKTYVMPKGTKRKGAWKHPWERMPQLRGDAEAGFILTKLGKGNRLTDFLHG